MSEASPKGKAHGCAALKPLPKIFQIKKRRKKIKKKKLVKQPLPPTTAIIRRVQR
jgi:hypothetical protein